jgi:hypothetical protein
MSNELDVPTRVAAGLFFIGTPLAAAGLLRHNVLLLTLGGVGAIAGILVFVAGWALRRRGRKR